jgi:hypothetical protein
MKRIASSTSPGSRPERWSTVAVVLLLGGCGGNAAPSGSPVPMDASQKTPPATFVTGLGPDGIDVTGPDCSGEFLAQSQAAIDELASCEVIHGLLHILSDQDLDLRPLRALRSVDALLISAHADRGTFTGITSLEGLENLQAIGYQLTLSSLPVRTLAPLRNVRVQAPESPLDGFILEINGCNYLEALDGLELGPHLSWIFLDVNEDLTSLDALGSGGALRSVRDIRLTGNPRLLDLDVFATLSDASNLWLSSLPQQHLSDFAALRRVEQQLGIGDSTELTDITLPQLESVGRLAIGGNPRLSELQLPSLAVIEQSLVIEDNPRLPASRVSPLEALALAQ